MVNISHNKPCPCVPLVQSAVVVSEKRTCVAVDYLSWKICLALVVYLSDALHYGPSFPGRSHVPLLQPLDLAMPAVPGTYVLWYIQMKTIRFYASFHPEHCSAPIRFVSVRVRYMFFHTSVFLFVASVGVPIRNLGIPFRNLRRCSFSLPRCSFS